ncbi:MAG: M28 family metallopeptidase, partial [Candidatus Bathyarchaeota archaeon]|nr:M28 family metallopeptidase [Candidatus Bathyarchaeota archaeon]
MKDKRIKQYLFLFPLILIAFSVAVPKCCSQAISGEIALRVLTEKNSVLTTDFIEESLKNIMSHVKNFSSFKTRVTGYPGSFEAADYIYNFFSKIGLSPEKKGYLIAVPLSRESYIMVGDLKFNAEPLWPNGVQTCKTPPEGISGRLVYIGDGSYEKIENVELKDSIAVMDFNSGTNWIRAADLGAKAIVFIESDLTSSLESLKKAVPAPINIPRLYVNRSVGEELIKLSHLNQWATIFNDMRWEEIEAYNVVSVIEGSTYPEEIIIVSAHYDSWSIVPALAYGAEDALSIAALLEFARYFYENRPARTLMFVAFSGYYQATAGSTNFVEQFFFSEEIQSGRKKIVLHIGLDFSTESDGLD